MYHTPVVKKKRILYSGIAIILFSCNTNPDTTTTTANLPDSVSTAVIKKDSNITASAILKSAVIDTGYFNKKTATTALVDKKLFKALGLDKVIRPEELNDPMIKFKLIDTLISTDKCRIIVLSAETENEHRAWLVQYDNNNALILSKQIFYEDFVEYFFTTTTKVKDSTIIITTLTNSDDNRSEKFEKYILKGGHTLELKK